MRPTPPDPVPPQKHDLAPLARELWAKAWPLPGTPAQLYLESRRIGHSTIGRYDPLAVTYERKKRLRLPALWLPDVERRELVALSPVSIDHDGNKHPHIEDAKRTLAETGRGAVHIGRIEGDQLNLADGIIV